eukprot:378919_1
MYKNFTTTMSRKYHEGDYVTTAGGVAKIKWIGRVKHYANRNKVYGVEYSDSTTGFGDGKFGDTRYFQGRKNKCTFVKYSQIIGLWVDKTEFEFKVQVDSAHDAHLALKQSQSPIAIRSTRWMPGLQREQRIHKMTCHCMSDGAYQNLKLMEHILKESKYSNTKI